MSYLAVLGLAAVWATVERTRAAIAGRGRTPAQISPLGLDPVGAESMTTRELEPERKAAQPLPSS
jgi:hypothetical protein